MKLFTQLALVTAIATCGNAAYAMQSMDDAALSDTTGQDGITIIIAPPALVAAQSNAYTITDADGTVRNIAAITQKKGIEIGAAVLHDKDGIRSAANPTGTSGGAIVIGDAKQANSTNTKGVQLGIYGSDAIKVNIDATGGGAAGAVSGSAPVLNIGLSLPSDLLIRTGDISVDGSKRGAIATGSSGATIANAATGGTTGNAIKVLNSMDIAIGGASMNIQLGNTPQGAMIVAGGTINGGLSISGLALHDGTATLKDVTGVANSNGGDLGVGVLTLTDSGTASTTGYTTGSNLTLSASINVVKNVGTAFGGVPTNGPQSQGGLLVTVGGGPIDIMMQNVTLGDAYAGRAAILADTSVTPNIPAQPAINPTGNSIGDLQLINVKAAGTVLAIMGH